MQPFVSIFGPLDAVAPVAEYVVLAFVLANMVTRLFAHKRHRSQYEEGGDEALARSPIHLASTVVLVVVSFYYTTLHQHAGIVLSTLVVGMVITDFFEYESRLVEARQELQFERPKAAIAASVLVVLYAGYLALFWIIKGPFEAVI
jgi:hypothetical protein